MNDFVWISDTTLRDGLQTPGLHLDLERKMRVAGCLETLGVQSLEIGFPASGAAEVRDMRAVASDVKRCMLFALCRARTGDVDAACSAFADVSKFRCGVNIFLATSAIHRTHKLRLSRRDLPNTI